MQRRHRHRKRRDGICGWHGCKTKSGARYYCDGHAEKRAATQKKQRKVHP